MKTPADVVIASFGIRPLADRLKVEPSTVWRWNKPKPRGCGGLIPSHYHQDILAFARAQGRDDITPEALIYGRPD